MKKGYLEDSFWKHLHPLKLPPESIRFSYTFCLGGSTFFLFFLLILTGILLAFYYLPIQDRAYPSITRITYLVPYGGFLRTLHYWSGQLMVLALILHMIRVFYYRAYRPPRQLNWWVGLCLFLSTLVIDFSGYVLRWDADTFAALQVATQLVREIPLLGKPLYILFVGGPEIGALTAIRFYLFHCLILPGLMILLIFYHFWRVRKDGLAGRPL